MRPLALFALAFLAGCAAGERAPHPASARQAEREPRGPVRHVVLVTVDGLLPDAYLHPEAHGLSIPTLRGLVARGAWSEGAESVYPTLTYPSHTSMQTGVVPGKHGIVSNYSFDPLGKDLDGWRWYAEDVRREPVYRAIENAGFRAGLVHWPVTVGARATWVVPEFWRARNDNDKKLVRAVSTPGLLERVAREHPGFWSRFTPPDVEDSALTDVALSILETGKPTFLALHLVGVDGAQHRTGLWSETSKKAIEEDDRQIARLLHGIEVAGISESTVLVVASDHGFMNVEKMVRPCVLLRDAGLVTLKDGKVDAWKAMTLSNSGHAYVYLADKNDRASRDALVALLRERAQDPTSSIARLYDEETIRRRGGDPDAIFAMEAEKGAQFGPGCAGTYEAPPLYKATHGYDPERPELRATLVIAGPTIPHRRIEGARLIDVGPTVAALLGVPFRDVDGTALFGAAVP